MVVTAKQPELHVDPIDWANVRLIYKKLQDDFHLITEPFGIRLSEQENLHLSHLIATIDSIDRALDPIPEAANRAQFANALIEYLKCDQRKIESDFATEEICQRMSNLRNVVIQTGCRDAFADTVTKVFEHTEAKRLATNSQDLIYHLKEEWRLAGHMTVLVMGSQTNPSFEKFFYLCCEMMTSVDMIKDAASDYSTGELALEPNLNLYGRLLSEFLLPLPKLIWRFPKPTNLVKYAVGFLFDVYIRRERSEDSSE